MTVAALRWVGGADLLFTFRARASLCVCSHRRSIALGTLQNFVFWRLKTGMQRAKPPPKHWEAITAVWRGRCRRCALVMSQQFPQYTSSSTATLETIRFTTQSLKNRFDVSWPGTNGAREHLTFSLAVLIREPPTLPGAATTCGSWHTFRQASVVPLVNYSKPDRVLAL